AEALRRAAAQRDLNVDSISEVLAWRVNRQTRLAASSPGYSPPEAWRALAWSLKAAEARGGNAADILRTIPPGADLETLALHAQHHARQHQTRHDTAPQNLPWLPTPAELLDNPHVDPELRDYLRDLGAHISERIRELADQIRTQPPAWAQPLAQPPTDAAKAHREWEHAAEIIAAYRDQHAIQNDDPNHPLGPYPDAGHAGHRAYWHAAAALLTAHHLTNPQPDPRGPNSPTGLAHPVEQHLAADITGPIYRSLPAPERTQVAAEIARRVGPAWPSNADPDTAATQPAYTTHLLAALAERGHITSHLAALAHRPDPEKRRNTPTPQHLDGRASTARRDAGTTSTHRPDAAPLPTPRPEPRPDIAQPRPRL
ncbi:MAG: hypothetical protein ACRDXX_00610, partial [Stackebrandtia sp.]